MTCEKCGIKGHSSNYCKSSYGKQESEGCFSLANLDGKNLCYIEISILNGSKERCLIDTGASISAISDDVCRKHRSSHPVPDEMHHQIK